jgi:plastocyanin
MTTLDTPTTAAAGPRAERSGGWLRLLAWSAGTGAAVDAMLMALVGEVIPPLAIGVVLTAAGIALLRRRPRFAIGLLGVTGALLVVTGAPFALPELAHPESGISFGHAIIHLVTRLVAVVAAVGAWRGGSPAAARRIGAVTAVAMAGAVAIAAIATLVTGSDAMQDGDVVVEVADFEFPPTVRVPTGGALFVDNADLLRHTFSVEGTGIAEELPARKSVRFGVDLPPGTYSVRCDVPGHDSMHADLVVG